VVPTSDHHGNPARLISSLKGVNELGGGEEEEGSRAAFQVWVPVDPLISFLFIYLLLSCILG